MLHKDILRQLTAIELTSVSGGEGDPFINFPPDGSPDQDFTFAGGSSGVAYQAGITYDAYRFIRDVVIEVIGNQVSEWINGGSTQEQWTTSNHTTNSLDERNLGWFWYDLNTGRSALTNYVDIPMSPIGANTFQSSYLGDTGGTNVFIANDYDGNGFIDHVYMQDSQGNWWVATSTSDGEPNWQPTTKPTRENLEHEQEFNRS